MTEDSPLLADLRAAYATGNLIVFAGAGISVAAGLPTWPELARQVLGLVRAAGASDDAVAEVEHLVKLGRLVDALSAAKEALGGHELEIAIEKAVDDTGRPPPEVVAAIAALAPRLRAVVTTNLDRFLERAFGGEWEHFTTPAGDLAQRRGYILKLHGTRGDRSSWVFTRRQYDRALFGRPELRATFEALFRTCPILFVGCGLADDDLDQTFAAIRALSGEQPPTHFAIVPDPVPPFRRKMLEQAGLRLLRYANVDGAHAEVPALLRSLVDKPKPDPR